MKKASAILGLVFISSTVFASGASKFESYGCGLQVGKSLAKLAGTSVSQDAVNLSEDISDYSVQAKLSKTTSKKKSDRDEAAQAASNTWQSIVYSMDKIKAVDKVEADMINEACDLGL